MAERSKVRKALDKLDSAVETLANAAYVANFGIAPPGGTVNWKDKARSGWHFLKKTARGAARVLLDEQETTNERESTDEKKE